MQTCNICQADKPLEEYDLHKGRVVRFCKECRRVKNRAAYKKNRSKHIAYASKKKEDKKAKLRAIKSQPCADCGISYPPYVMDFDHVRGKKEFNIGENALFLAWSRVETEIAKCDIICSNCHRERTHKRRLDLDN